VRTFRRDYDFPEPELLTSLVAIFFQHIAPMVPLLHRPTFMNAINDGLHLRDNKFGAVVLLVCATASRYSHDPRNLTEDGQLRNAGWKWFKQVEPFSNSALFGPQLHDLQIAAVSVHHSLGRPASSQADAKAFRDVYPWYTTSPRLLDNSRHRSTPSSGCRRPPPTTSL
jgi:Fungal specific transcription factor domain